MLAPTHISIAQFDDLKALLAEDFVALMNTYITDSEQRLLEMATAFHAADNRAGFEAAHSLKGASSNLGAEPLTTLCHELQEHCRAGHIMQQGDLIAAITTECRAVNTEILSLIEQD